MNANVSAPGPVGATKRVPVVWRNRTVHMEYQWIAAERSDAPLVVFLHEGLGSVAMWKDFPSQLCDAGGLRGLVFSRPAYGRSTPRGADEVWGPDFMHQQAHEVVPAFLDALGVQEADGLRDQVTGLQDFARTVCRATPTKAASAAQTHDS